MHTMSNSQIDTPISPQSYHPGERLVTISKTDLALLPAAAYEGNIVLVDNESKISDAIDALRSADILGFDTETRPSFKKGASYNVSLMQISTRDTCYLFRLNLIGVPDALRDLLEDENVLKIGLSLHDDFHNLNKICSINPAGFIDLQHFVKDWMIVDNSLSRIYGIIFGQRISKGQRLTNWQAQTLTESQQTYAALDALACIHIYETLTHGDFDPLKSKYLTRVVDLPENHPYAPRPEKPKEDQHNETLESKTVEEKKAADTNKEKTTSKTKKQTKTTRKPKNDKTVKKATTAKTSKSGKTTQKANTVKSTKTVKSSKTEKTTKTAKSEKTVKSVKTGEDNQLPKEN